LSIIENGAVVVALGLIGIAAIVIAIGVIGIEPDRLIIIGHGAVVVALAEIGDRPVVVGDGPVRLGFAIRLDQRRATADLAIPRRIRAARAQCPFPRQLARLLAAKSRDRGGRKWRRENGRHHGGAKPRRA
jgi:carbonic anhydrase/acetyltransferase-like protein (isoleucine patch superfamily)